MDQSSALLFIALVGCLVALYYRRNARLPPLPPGPPKIPLLGNTLAHVSSSKPSWLKFAEVSLQYGRKLDYLVAES